MVSKERLEIKSDHMLVDNSSTFKYDYMFINCLTEAIPWISKEEHRNVIRMDEYKVGY